MISVDEDALRSEGMIRDVRERLKQLGIEAKVVEKWNGKYAELSDFWAVWIKEELGLKGLIDNREEVQCLRVNSVGAGG
jgi:hypothetical protein